MKKNLPLIFIGGGVLIVILAVLIVLRTFKSSASSAKPTPEEVVQELPQSQWPVLTLTSTTDPLIPNSLGHLLKLQVQKINVPGASSMDYLLVYNTIDGGQQGVPGTVQLTGSDVDRNLLLGSESSKHFRFDEGVNKGTITITFRNSSGKSMGKLSSDFHLQTAETALTSIDGKFSYTLDKIAKGVYFVTMPTFLEPDPSMYVTWQNGYGVFASDGNPHSGK